MALTTSSLSLGISLKTNRRLDFTDLQKFKSTILALKHVIQKQNIIILIIVSLIFLLPFFWFPTDAFNLGGDDSRLYLYDPLSFLKNVAFYSTNYFGATGIGSYNPQEFYFPFCIFLTLMKTVTLNFNLQKLVYGLTLALSFLTSYSFIGELIQDKHSLEAFAARTLGALFYVLHPLVAWCYWGNPLLSVYGMFVYPTLLLCFLKCLNTGRMKYLFYGAVVSLVFSGPIFAFPDSLVFVIGSSFFLLLYFALHRICWKNFLSKITVYIGLIMLLNAYYVIPLIHSLTTKESTIANVAWSVELRKSAVRLVTYLAKFINVFTAFLHVYNREFVYAFGNKFSKELIDYQYLLLPFKIFLTVCIFLGLIFSDKRKHLLEYKNLVASAATTLVLVYLLTVNIGPWGVKLFTFLIENIPSFVIFRNFQARFPMSYVFFSSITLGISIYLVLTKLKNKCILKNRCVVSCVYLIILLMATLLQALPFISGEITNPLAWGALEKNINYTFNVKFSDDFTNAIKYVEELDRDGAILVLPLTSSSWQISKTSIGIYVGLSPINVFTGRRVFVGEFSFLFYPGLSSIVEKAIENGDYDFLKRLFGLLNIKYIFYDTSIFDRSVPDTVRKSYLWPTADKLYFDRLVYGISAIELKRFGPIFIYKMPDEYLKPEVYITRNIAYCNGSLERILVSPFINQDEAFYLLYDNYQVLNLTSKILIYLNYDRENSHEFYVPKSGTYSIYDIYDDRSYVKVIESIELREGRQSLNAFFSTISTYNSNKPSNLLIYGDFVAHACSGNIRMSFKKVSPVKYVVEVELNNASSFFLVLSTFYHQGWKIYSGDVNWLEALCKNPISEDTHFIVNGYANAWYINATNISQKTLTLTIFFYPQIFFYIGLIISSLTIIILTIYFIHRYSFSVVK